MRLNWQMIVSTFPGPQDNPLSIWRQVLTSTSVLFTRLTLFGFTGPFSNENAVDTKPSPQDPGPQKAQVLISPKCGSTRGLTTTGWRNSAFCWIYTQLSNKNHFSTQCHAAHSKHTTASPLSYSRKATHNLRNGFPIKGRSWLMWKECNSLGKSIFKTYQIHAGSYAWVFLVLQNHKQFWKWDCSSFVGHFTNFSLTKYQVQTPLLSYGRLPTKNILLLSVLV